MFLLHKGYIAELMQQPLVRRCRAAIARRFGARRGVPAAAEAQAPGEYAVGAAAPPPRALGAGVREPAVAGAGAGTGAVAAPEEQGQPADAGPSGATTQGLPQPPHVSAAEEGLRVARVAAAVGPGARNAALAEVEVAARRRSRAGPVTEAVLAIGHGDVTEVGTVSYGGGGVEGQQQDGPLAEERARTAAAAASCSIPHHSGAKAGQGGEPEPAVMDGV